MRNSLLTSLFLTLALLFSTNLIFAQAEICGIRLAQGTRAASFAHGQRVVVDFDYVVEEISGARIFVRPFTDGALSPGYAASGSPLYAGAGTGDAFFQISSGEVHVDEIRILVTTEDQSSVLKEMWVPVDYYFGESGVNNFIFSHDPSISSFLLTEKFQITFDYEMNHAGGNRIFIRPFTDGALTPGYTASGSPSFSGTGNHTVNFSIKTGTNIHVDSLRVAILNNDQSTTLQEFFIPVNLYFSTVKVDNILAQGSNFAVNTEKRTIDFQYETTEAGGVRIFPRPYSHEGLTPNYSACGSPSFTGNGTHSCDFSISSGNQYVDHIRFQAFNDDQSELLLEFKYPVNYTFGEVLIDNLTICPQNPVRLNNGERVNLEFEVKNNTGGDIRIFPRPFTEGALSPGYGASGSPAYGVGPVNASAFFTINSGDVKVDHIRFKITNADQSVDLGEFFLDADVVFGNLTTGIEEEEVLSDFNVYPNPFQQKLAVEFTPKVTEDVEVFVTDMTGRKVGMIASQKMPAGQEQILSLNADELKLIPGMYMVVLRGSTFSTARKVVYTP